MCKWDGENCCRPSHQISEECTIQFGGNERKLVFFFGLCKVDDSFFYNIHCTSIIIIDSLLLLHLLPIFFVAIQMLQVYHQTLRLKLLSYVFQITLPKQHLKHILFLTLFIQYFTKMVRCQEVPFQCKKKHVVL